MAKRTVVWTKTADIQFVGILEYWVKRNKSSSYSKKLLKLVVARTKQIAQSPFISYFPPPLLVENTNNGGNEKGLKACSEFCF